jgi:hypothetical protein
LLALKYFNIHREINEIDERRNQTVFPELLVLQFILIRIIYIPKNNKVYPLGIIVLFDFVIVRHSKEHDISENRPVSALRGGDGGLLLCRIHPVMKFLSL